MHVGRKTVAEHNWLINMLICSLLVIPLPVKNVKLCTNEWQDQVVYSTWLMVQNNDLCRVPCCQFSDFSRLTVDHTGYSPVFKWTLRYRST